VLGSAMWDTTVDEQRFDPLSALKVASALKGRPPQARVSQEPSAPKRVANPGPTAR